MKLKSMEYSNLEVKTEIISFVWTPFSKCKLTIKYYLVTKCDNKNSNKYLNKTGKHSKMQTQ